MWRSRWRAERVVGWIGSAACSGMQRLGLEVAPSRTNADRRATARVTSHTSTRAGVHIAKRLQCGLRPRAPGGDPTCSSQALTSPRPWERPALDLHDGSGTPCPGPVVRSIPTDRAALSHDARQKPPDLPFVRLAAAARILFQDLARNVVVASGLEHRHDRIGMVPGPGARVGCTRSAFAP